MARAEAMSPHLAYMEMRPFWTNTSESKLSDSTCAWTARPAARDGRAAQALSTGGMVKASGMTPERIISANKCRASRKTLW